MITQINGRIIHRVSAAEYPLYLYLYRAGRDTVFQRRRLYNHSLRHPLIVLLQLIIKRQRLVISPLLRPAQISGPHKVQHIAGDSFPIHCPVKIPKVLLVGIPYGPLLCPLRCLLHRTDGHKNLLKPSQIVPAEFPETPSRTEKRHRKRQQQEKERRLHRRAHKSGQTVPDHHTFLHSSALQHCKECCFLNTA